MVTQIVIIGHFFDFCKVIKIGEIYGVTLLELSDLAIPRQPDGTGDFGVKEYLPDSVAATRTVTPFNIRVFILDICILYWSKLDNVFYGYVFLILLVFLQVML